MTLLCALNILRFLIFLSYPKANNDGAVTLNYGSFIHSMISFLFMSLFLFLIYRALTRLRKSVELELKSQGIVSNGQLKKNGDNKGSTL